LVMADALQNSMRKVGRPVNFVYMEKEKRPAPLFYNTEEVIIFNLCDGVPGISRSWSLAAEELEEYGFAFTGADSEALLLSQDKAQIKRQLHKQGINIPKWEEYSTLENITWKNFPSIVKPAFEHCSYGITRESVVQTLAELIHRMRYVLEEFQQPVLVEEFIDGREFHVGLIGNGHPFVLPPAEIDYSAFSDIHDRLCTYESKFDKTSLAYRLTAPGLPVEMTVNQSKRLNEMVTTAYQTTGCRDYARMDIRLRDGVFYILDVNHNADISPETSMILAAEKAGLSYGRFGSLLVNLAAHRHKVFENSRGRGVFNG
jgi:D-alanine-D-alanine ligase